MQKFTGLIIAGSLTAFLLVMLGGLGAWIAGKNQAPATPVATIAAPVATIDSSAGEMAALQQTMQQRSLTYQQQLTALQTSLQDRQAAYQTELGQAAAQLAEYNAAIDQQRQILDTLNAQTAQLEQALAQRQADYQAQLTQTLAELQTRANQLTASLQEGKAALAAANAQLGR